MSKGIGFFGVGSDHELQAYESMDWEDGECCSEPFVVDRNFYHTWITFDFIARETEKSYLIVQTIAEQEGINLWIPKKIVRNIKDNKMLVHKNVYLAILTRYAEDN